MYLIALKHNLAKYLKLMQKAFPEQFNFFPKTVFRKVTLGANARSFAYNSFEKGSFSYMDKDMFLNYLRVSPGSSPYLN